MSRETIQSAEFVVTGRPRLGIMPRYIEVDLAEYERRLRPMQNTLQLVQQAYLGARERAVIVLEGWDTAGKGGVVRRLGWSLDPRSFRVYPIGPPSDREKAHHYLQRFWARLPEHGAMVLFDRSWYGRVLVERVEGLAAEQEWKRAYREINEFEHMLVADNTRLIKIFLDITADEQLRRFKERLTNPSKRWKLTYEDFRNRDHWNENEEAIKDMMEKTSTKKSPWHLIPANNKLFARLAAFRIMVDRLGVGVPLEPRPLAPSLAEIVGKLMQVTPAKQKD